MKEDVEIPPGPPRKRRQLEDPGQTLDKWLAVWATDESLPPSQRARAQAERDRRKALVPDVRLGVIVGVEGMTPAQREVVAASMANATELHWLTSTFPHLRRALVELGRHVAGTSHEDPRDVVRHSSTLVAAPKEPEKPDRVEGVWEAVRYAKHRKVPVRVVLPNGDER
jgi:hypothetical protein